MNAERLHSVIQAIFSDNESLQILSRLSGLQSAYSSTVSQPTPDTAQVFQSARQELELAIRDSKCAKLSPSRTRILREIGGTRFCGRTLLEEVERIINAGPTPASVVEGLQELQKEASRFFKAVNQLAEWLPEIKVAIDELPDDQCEVGITIPRGLIHNNLDGLETALSRIDNSIRAITEAATGETGSPTIRTISSSDISVFVQVDLVSGTQILQALAAIVVIYNNVLQIRKNRTELQKTKIPEKLVDEIRDYERKYVRDELKKAVEEIVNQATGQRDTGRKNELRNGVEGALNYLAAQIDRGMEVEVTAPDVLEEEESDEPAEGADSQRTNKLQAIERIRAEGGVIATLERVAEPVLLLETEASQPEDGKAGKPRSKRAE